MAFRAVIFDLDGTLLNSLQDIANSGNAVLSRHGFPTHPIESYKHFVGDGMKVLIQRIAPKDIEINDEFMQTLFEEAKQEYSKRWNDTAHPYDGAFELLNDLKSKDIKTAILSNKPHEYTLQCIEEFFPWNKFSVVQGLTTDMAKKPDPTGALYVADQLNEDVGNIIYVGDSDVDMQTALNAGMYPVGVSWGFRSIEELKDNGAKKIIHQPAELLGLFE